MSVGEVPATLRHAGVTQRELDVLRLVGLRLRNSEIAAQLFVSERTVESHVSALLRKLGGSDRLSLAAAAELLNRAGVPAWTLPRQLTSFIGREEEMARLSELLTLHRLVTVTGPAGTGKTRLALEVAAGSERGIPLLIDLASLPPEGDVAGLVADSLGLEHGGGSLPDRLTEALRESETWILADNCEHVVEALAELLREWMPHCPALRVLTTSRRPLRVEGEALYELGPLSVPSETDDPAEVLASSAGRLFAERGASSLASFSVNPENAGAVAALCQHLDGLPLALELAAARLRALTPQELLAHLDEALLIAGPGGAITRHSTLEAALQWSLELLSDEELFLFERCSVFPADFDYDTAEQVLATPPLTGPDVRRLLPQLVDHSLVSARTVGGITVFRMLDSVRHAAAARLAERGESELLAGRHARYHLDHALELAEGLRGPDQPRALSWFEQRWPDLRTAMSWTLDGGRTADAWAFLAGIGMGWETLGVRREIFDWLDQLEKSPPPAALNAGACAAAAVVLCCQDTGAALDRARQGAVLAADGDSATAALTQLALGWALGYHEGSGSGQSELEAAEQNFAAFGDRWHQALALEGLGLGEEATPRSVATLLRAAALFGEHGDQVKRANCLNQMAHRCVDAGIRLDEASAWLEEARALALATGNEHELLHSDLFRARLDLRTGNRVAAAAGFGLLLGGFRRIGDRRCAARCLLGLGQTAALRGDSSAAVGLLIESAGIAATTTDAYELTTALALLATCALTRKGPRAAAVLLGAAEAAAVRLDDARRDAIPELDEARAALKGTLDREEWEAALAEGARSAIPALLHV
ncbi:LuxR C-terminal-related transcriptional regulator [Sinomonas sp. ASV322]|uniref:ATP-binding protein n=1 Tax=Sinomonas sp. ASV322 TaxID=3041920 RepID=UPI0027DE23B1|nr:LuxR C-terminal-related transcriptional regulator [Sinomonas sp. ASV322]MDQ4504597.1 LuxR C-terminal-related transcriptional regulator [Sinomonas sp. ASV322]